MVFNQVEYPCFHVITNTQVIINTWNEILLMAMAKTTVSLHPFPCYIRMYDTSLPDIRLPRTDISDLDSWNKWHWFRHWTFPTAHLLHNDPLTQHSTEPSCPSSELHANKNPVHSAIHAVGPVLCQNPLVPWSMGPGMGPARGGWRGMEGGSLGAYPGPGPILQSLQPNAHNMGPGYQTRKHTIHLNSCGHPKPWRIRVGGYRMGLGQIWQPDSQIWQRRSAKQQWPAMNGNRLNPDPPRCPCFKTPAHTLPVTFPFVLLWSIVVPLLKAHIKQHGLDRSTNNIWQRYKKRVISETCSRLQQALQNNVNKAF